ncbi:MAG TPA: ATP synthase F1 subunit delta [bacterium]|jgi:F-type H+-transporting ATPase subunit delta
MKNEALIRTYTRPLFDLAVESRQLDAIGADVKTLADLYQQVPMLAEYLDSSNISRARKTELLKQAYDKPWSTFFANFLDLILRKGRQNILPEAWGAYQQFWDDYHQKLDVTVTTAVELTPEQRAALEQKLAAKTGKKITLKSFLDPQVLGGIRIQIGHQLVDGTIANMLSTLKQSLLPR